MKRVAPTLVAGVLSLAYVVVSPASRDLAAHLTRAKLFELSGFGLWSNWWYGGHNLPGYSVLFPPVAALLSPQFAAAVAVTGSAALFESLARRHFGEEAWVGSILYALGSVSILLSGRLTFAFGMLPALATAVLLQRGRTGWACVMAAVTALASPVAALFVALGGGALAIGDALRARQQKLKAPQAARAGLRGVAVAAAALAPVLLLAIAFPEGGTEPFRFTTLWPILAVCALVFFLAPGDQPVLRAGVALYAFGVFAAYEISTPVGSNAARLGALAALPVVALLLWRRRPLWLLIAFIPLVVLQWKDGISDLSVAAGAPSTKAGYWAPLERFFERQPGPPFRVEIPFTDLHWEAYFVAMHTPIARGWERQLDVKLNPIFYTGRLTPARYESWLHRMAVRFVAVADAPKDHSAKHEVALIDRGLPYLRPVKRLEHFRIYEVEGATSLAQGAATVTNLGINSVTLQARRAGRVLLHVRWSPYWALQEAKGCVRKAGDFTALDLKSAGPAKLVTSFSPWRIGSTGARCNE